MDRHHGSEDRSVREPAEHEPRILIRQLGRTLGALRHAYEAELGIGARSAWALSLLSRHDGLSQNDLSCTMRVDPSLVTRTAQEMEKKLGWVRRERDPEDNRVVRVYLTETGRTQAQNLCERVTALDRRLTRNLTPEQVDDLFSSLQALETAAREVASGE
ncbi:MAG: MarR family transcriptional regulator [Chloroflexota bacterium]|nr:MarR family transcriptional regulator [Chloroflexota bacterium]